MGRLIDGVWVANEEQTRVSEGGDFVRGRTKFRDWIREDGSTPFAPEAGRYHLWVAHNCPWAHRTLIARNLLGLQEAISTSVAHFRRDEGGWWFPEGIDRFQPEEGRLPLHRVYAAASDAYTGSATVPVLWDRSLGTIVSNESAEIIRMLATEFNAVASSPHALYPQPLRKEIDDVSEGIYRNINNGVYKCGFARTQEAYERAFVPLFEELDAVEQRLDRHRFLVGFQITVADIQLFTTLARFDAVYYSHFKCNKRRLVDFPNMWGYFKDLYQTPGFSETVHIDLYKKGYYGRSPGLNPRGIIPLGPDLDFEASHDRATRTYS